MKLPNAERATVPEEKIVRYLLNPAHPIGGSKAAFFLRHGFSVLDRAQFASELRRHALENEVSETEQSRHGTRFVVDGPLPAPDGTILNVRAAWYINPGAVTPRFVTAHPLPKI